MFPRPDAVVFNAGREHAREAFSQRDQGNEVHIIGRQRRAVVVFDGIDDAPRHPDLFREPRPCLCVCAGVKIFFLLKHAVRGLYGLEQIMIQIIQNDSTDIMQQPCEKAVLRLGHGNTLGEESRKHSYFIAVHPEVLDFERAAGRKDVHDGHADGDGLDPVEAKKEQSLVDVGDLTGMGEKGGVGHLQHALGQCLVTGDQITKIVY